VDRQEYNTCIKPYMSGKGKSKEERQMAMCVGAKLCTGKAATEDEAKKICENLPPKEPKAEKPIRIRKCPIVAQQVTDCLIGKLENVDLKTVKLGELLKNMVPLCLCGKAPKVTKAQKAQKAYDDMTDEEKKALQTIAEVSQYYGTA